MAEKVELQIYLLYDLNNPVNFWVLVNSVTNTIHPDFCINVYRDVVSTSNDGYLMSYDSLFISLCLAKFLDLVGWL